MKTIIYAVIIFVLIESNAASNRKIMIDPTSACSIGCSGSTIQPFNNLLSAMQAEFPEAQLEYVLYNNENPHYLLSQEGLPSDVAETIDQIFSLNREITIRALYCDDLEVINNEVNPEACIDHSRHVKVVLKNQLTTWLIQNKLTVKNIDFDGIEDIAQYNSDPSVGDCIYYRKKCCNQGSSTSVYPPLLCSVNSKVLNNSQFTNGFFVLNQSQGVLEIENCLFQNIVFSQKSSWITVLQGQSLVIRDTLIENDFFPYGFISGNISSVELSNFEMDNITFANSNPYKWNFSRDLTFRGTLINIRGFSTHTTLLLSDMITENHDLINPESIFFCGANCVIESTNFTIKNISLTTNFTNLIFLQNSSLSIEGIKIESINATSSSIISIDQASTFRISHGQIHKNIIGNLKAAFSIQNSSSSVIFNVSVTSNTFLDSQNGNSFWLCGDWSTCSFQNVQVAENIFNSGWMFTHIQDYSQLNLDDFVVKENIFPNGTLNQKILSLYYF